MGSDVAPRKEFLVQGAYEVDVDDARRLTQVGHGALAVRLLTVAR